MEKAIRIAAAVAASIVLAAAGATALAQGKGRDKDREQHGQGADKERGKEKARKAKHENGKSLVGDKVKKNGKQKFDQKGKHSAFVDVRDGKIAGVTVEHAEKGAVPVKKYKTNQKVVDAGSGFMHASMQLAQSSGTVYIGYAYWDDYYQEEVIYWFPYDMVYDPDTGAVEYVPAY